MGRIVEPLVLVANRASWLGIRRVAAIVLSLFDAP